MFFVFVCQQINKYQKYKSVQLGDQLNEKGPDPTTRLVRSSWSKLHFSVNISPAWESPLLETIAHDNMDGRDKQTDSNHLSRAPAQQLAQQAHA